MAAHFAKKLLFQARLVGLFPVTSDRHTRFLATSFGVGHPDW